MSPVAERTLTIGAVREQLRHEFPDISISKIRYLEDQKLLQPKRTSGGYRQYTTADVERLRAILRMQRDEFMPLRVIRQELAAGRAGESPAPTGPVASAGQRRTAAPRAGSVLQAAPAARIAVAQVLAETGADPGLIRELADFGLIEPRQVEGETTVDATERQIIRAAAELARYGVAGRNLRILKTSADREAQLLQQLLSPSLRSRNPAVRSQAMEALETLAATASHLHGLLLVRDLRKLI